MISTLFKHKSLLLTLCATAYIACGTIGYACPPPPECDTPDRYVMWAKNTSTSAIIAQSELGESVFLDYYATPRTIMYMLVGQNYINGQYEPFVEWFDYSYGTHVGCGDCTAKQSTFSYSGGSQTANYRNTITVQYNQQPLAGYVRGTHNGWDCWKDGYGSFIIPGSSQISMDVYVVKVDIKRNGVSIDDQSVIVSVGDKISLVGTVEPSDIYLFAPSLQWTIPNAPIKNYITTPTLGQKVEMEASDYQNGAIDYYWYEGADNQYVAYIVELPSGMWWGSGAYFDIKRPIADTEVTRGPIELDPQINPTQLKNGIAGDPGIGIIYSNTQTFGINGTFKWIQLLDNTLRRARLEEDWIRKVHVSNEQVPWRIDSNEEGYIFTMHPFVDNPHVDFFIELTPRQKVGDKNTLKL